MTDKPEMELRPWKRRVTLANCPIGLFYSDTELCLKTEYGNNEGRIDAFIVSSGEFFWGHAPQTIESQRASLVRPVTVARPIPGPQAVERVARVHSLRATEGTPEFHARKDLEYIEGLQAHCDEGGKVSPKNVSDLIAMVRWNAESLLAALRPSEQSPTVEAGMDLGHG